MKSSCKDWDQCYIGMRKQHIKNRVYQHKYESKEKNKEENTKRFCHYTISLNVITLIIPWFCNMKKIYQKTKISEVIYITFNKIVNKKIDIDDLIVLSLTTTVLVKAVISNGAIPNYISKIFSIFVKKFMYFYR